MKTSKAFFALLSLLVFPLSLIRPNETIGDVKEELSIAQKQDRSRKYLMSLDHPDLSVSDSEINYSVRLRSGNQGSVAACSSGEATEYSFKYIKMLDLVAIDSEGKTYYGYPFINSKGEKDVLLEADGIRSVYSESAEQFGFASIPITITKPDSRIPTDPGYPVMKIVSELANFDDIIGVAKRIMDVPDLKTDGPIPYLLYRLKLKMILNDYNSNILVEYQPKGFINDQSVEGLNDWTFGISYVSGKGFENKRGNFHNNGCGIIAIYNLFYDSGAKPDLASVIALTQMCNADVAQGLFGVNPINKDSIDDLKPGIKVLYETVLAPLVGDLMDVVTKIIHQNILDKILEEPWWLLFMTGAFPVIATLTIKMVLAALETVVAAVSLAGLFIDEYLKHIGDISMVVGLLTGNDYEAVDCLKREDFIDNISKYRQGIITFWNKANDDGSPKIDEGAHTIYVKKQPFSLLAYNAADATTEPAQYYLSNLNKTQPFGNENQYIYGYVWREKQ